MAFLYTLGCGVTKASLAAFIRRAHESGVDIHALPTAKTDRSLRSWALPPYAFDQRAQLYSLSKSFTSIAVGIAADEGLLRADEKIADIFPDKLPADAPEAAREVRLCDLLSMQSGHAVCALESHARGRPGGQILTGARCRTSRAPLSYTARVRPASARRRWNGARVCR